MPPQHGHQAGAGYTNPSRGRSAGKARPAGLTRSIASFVYRLPQLHRLGASTNKEPSDYPEDLLVPHQEMPAKCGLRVFLAASKSLCCINDMLLPFDVRGSRKVYPVNSLNALKRSSFRYSKGRYLIVDSLYVWDP